MSKSIYIPIFFLVFGIVAIYFGVSTQIENNSLKQSGIVVQSLDIEGNTDVIRNGSHTIREIAPKFKTKKSEIISCRANISDDIQATLSESPIVKIRYLAENPKVCQVIGSETNSNIAPFILGVIAILGSLFFLVKGFKK